jgi:(1->4)-alpha-D-glucan 1-alpha-D-glucosylmutase
MRMAALAGMAGPWTALADRVLSGTAPMDTSLGLRLLQVAIGIWPITDDGTAPLAEVLDRPDLLERFVHYAVVVARGQDTITSHLDPDLEVEAQLSGWVRALLDADGGVAADLRGVGLRAAEVGMAASLSQTLLRLAVPGVPDTYQGTERWDDSLSDPDNCRPVDFELRRRTAEAWTAQPPSPGQLWASRRDGRIKQWVLQRALDLRRDLPDVLGPEGAYAPLPSSGRWAAHVMAFSRSLPGRPTVVAVCPRMLGRVTDGGNFAPVGRIWADTELDLPDIGGGVADGPRWTDVLSGHTVPGQATIAIADLLCDLPVALLVSTTPTT